MALKSRAPNGISRAGCRCTRCAPILITDSPKRYTTYGVIGVKCWIYRGEILPQKKREATPQRETAGAF